jgi:hypothetical protein
MDNATKISEVGLVSLIEAEACEGDLEPPQVIPAFTPFDEKDVYHSFL